MSLNLPKLLYGIKVGSCKMEEFGFAMFHDEASIDEGFGYNIVATEKKGRE